MFMWQWKSGPLVWLKVSDTVWQAQAADLTLEVQRYEGGYEWDIRNSDHSICYWCGDLPKTLEAAQREAAKALLQYANVLIQAVVG